MSGPPPLIKIVATVALRLGASGSVVTDDLFGRHAKHTFFPRFFKGRRSNIPKFKKPKNRSAHHEQRTFIKGEWTARASASAAVKRTKFQVRLLFCCWHV
jgi:hypothetical protein